MAARILLLFTLVLLRVTGVVCKADDRKSSDHPSNDGQRHCEQLKNSITPGLIGAYIPQCDDNGNFKPLQCWGSVGSCWCANVFTGKPVTKKTRGIKSEFCDNPCFKAKIDNPPPAYLIQGAPVEMKLFHQPKCDSKGFYEPKQCDDASCWCVDSHSGKEIKSTRRTIGKDITC